MVSNKYVHKDYSIVKVKETMLYFCISIRNRKSHIFLYIVQVWRVNFVENNNANITNDEGGGGIGERDREWMYSEETDARQQQQPLQQIIEVEWNFIECVIDIGKLHFYNVLRSEQNSCFAIGNSPPYKFNRYKIMLYVQLNKQTEIRKKHVDCDEYISRRSWDRSKGVNLNESSRSTVSVEITDRF